MNFQRNNLGKASSPYLLQHKDNPIWWQEWNQDVLDYAKRERKLIFVSIGYSTCHWCHVMAGEAFSDSEIADFLNAHFVSIKVDREQRPDIDAYFMSFLTEIQGHGGWPLNAFLTPNKKIMFAGTYFPVEARAGLKSFLFVLHQILDFYRKHGEENFRFFSPSPLRQAFFEEEEIIRILDHSFDSKSGGFGRGTKFPPHCTLLFLLYYRAFRRERKKNDDFENQRIEEIIRRTLDMMAMRGLHDHLQGGFFRYSVDQNWSIPHFEKMLYDQAMHLMNYSLAHRLFGDEFYKKIAGKLIKCLKETFYCSGLYISAHDADTDHEEGATYLWDVSDLKKNLTAAEFERFSDLYDLSHDFEGKIHLLKNDPEFLDKEEEKLLRVRLKRPQPGRDEKFLTSWNAMIGVGLIFAWRYGQISEAKEMALELFDNLVKKHYKDKKLIHSSYGEISQEMAFLEDYSAFLLFVTYIYEETRDQKIYSVMADLQIKIWEFFQDGWKETLAENDFFQTEADSFDHPIPSSESLAEMALRRANILAEKEDCKELDYRSPFNHDFYNFTAFFSRGNEHLIKASELLEWKNLPIASLQVPASDYQDCVFGSCRKFKDRNELERSFDGL